MSKTSKPLIAFYYKDELYLRTIPGKRLFNSTMVHEVVNRGDIFAIKLSDQSLTIIPGIAQVTHITIGITEPVATTKSTKSIQAELEL